MKLLQTENVGYGSFVVLENDLIGYNMLKRGCWEEHLFMIYSNFIKPEHIIIDAGANIGFHTIQFAKLGKLVYAFEPQSMVFNILSTNILFNDLTDKVKHYRLGLYDKKTELHMQGVEQFTDENGYINYGGRGVTDEIVETERVDLVRWDDYFSDVDRIDFMKMDIQGAELSALKGMESILNKCKPWMLLENYDNENDAPVIEYLLGLGYTVYRPMTIFPNEDCICLHNDIESHSEIQKFIEAAEIEWKIYK